MDQPEPNFELTNQKQEAGQRERAILPGLRVRTQLQAGGSGSNTACKICRRNCTIDPDYYSCISQCELVCG